MKDKQEEQSEEERNTDETEDAAGKPRKSHRLRTIIIVLVVIILLAAMASGGSGDENETETEAETNPKTETETEDGYEWDAGGLAYLDMSRDELLAVYTAYDDILDKYDGDPMSMEDIDAYEKSCTEQIAEEYGLSTDDIDQIYFYGSKPGYFATFDADTVDMKYGDTVNVNVNGSVITVEAKITPSWNNKMTIDQNYYNVCDFIRKYAGTGFTKISYWAIADMSDGSEQKVISFDVPEYMIEKIATQDFADNTLGDYVENLYIHQSLRDD